MRLHIRRAVPIDADAMAELLNRIIAAGDTTTMTTPVTGAELAQWMTAGGRQTAWHVAETDLGEIVGFQWVEPHPDLPDDTCDIASIVQTGETGLGIGSRLFDTTRHAAAAIGYRWINATIRADNSGGLTYYQSRGFEAYGTARDILLADGRKVDKISMRFDLR